MAGTISTLQTLNARSDRDQNREGDLSVGGQKGTLNSLQVDGVDITHLLYIGRTGCGPAYESQRR